MSTTTSSSLWLLPPTSSPFTTSLQELITTTLPSNFSSAPKHPFLPHLTVTSSIAPSTYSSSPQAWLDALSLPPGLQKEKNEVHVEFETLESSEHFFRKVTLSASKQANLVKLAAMCREQAVQISAQDAEEWAEKEFSPHLSLFYGDVPLTDVKKKIPMIELQLGFEFGSLFDCCGGTLAMGARLALVETGKEIKDWELIAERELPWVMWKMARGLL